MDNTVCTLRMNQFLSLALKFLTYLGLFCHLQCSTQRARLLDNTERVERSGRQLEEGYKMCVETGKAVVDVNVEFYLVLFFFIFWYSFLQFTLDIIFHASQLTVHISHFKFHTSHLTFLFHISYLTKSLSKLILNWNSLWYKCDQISTSSQNETYEMYDFHSYLRTNRSWHYE